MICPISDVLLHLLVNNTTSIKSIRLEGNGKISDEQHSRLRLLCVSELDRPEGKGKMTNNVPD
jgi:hypothetical protein